MNFSLFRAKESCIVWMSWFLGGWLLLEAGPLVLGIWVFSIPAHRLIAPYIAFAIAPATVGPFIYRINRRRGDPPKRRARDMGIASVVFLELAIAALLYSAVRLGLTSVNFAVTDALVVFLLSGPIIYFGAYIAALAKASR